MAKYGCFPAPPAWTRPWAGRAGARLHPCGRREGGRLSQSEKEEVAGARCLSRGGRGGARGETHSRITPDYRWGVRNATRPR